MDHQKKLDFVLKMTKHALEHVQHFDEGGTVLGGPVQAGVPNSVNPNAQGIAGTVGSVLGTNNMFQANGANINPGTNTAQINHAYTGAQGALDQAGNLTSTLTPGVTQGAGSQAFLTGQLTNEAQGIGPNPAQATLNQNTGRNIEQQAALAAGTRGAGANAGLIAENAARQGAATQQQAVGQSATLQAEQQLAAQGALANLAGNQINQGTGAVQLSNQTQQNEQNILQGANTAANSQNVAMQSNINNANAAVAAGNQNANQNVIQGLMKGVGSAASLFAEGGEVAPEYAHLHGMAKIYHPHLAEGGAIGPWQMSTPAEASVPGAAPVELPSYSGPFGKEGGGSLKGDKKGGGNSTPGTAPTGADGSYGLGGAEGIAQLGPPVTPDFTSSSFGAGIGSAASQAPSLGAVALAQGGRVGAPMMKSGGKVPGKPKVGHDDYSNDTVSAKLSPGEVVIDLDTLKDKGKLGQMARFVAANIERKKAGRKL